MQEIIVSIVIPVYNVEKYIGKCLESCIMQNNVSFKDYEIIVINDGTPDDSMKIVRKYKELYPNITIVEQENKGLGAARNVGIRNAKGKYIQFVDSDDYISSDTIFTIKHIVDKNDFDIITIAAKNICKENVRNILPTSINSGKELLKYHINHCSVFYVYSKIFLLNNNLYYKEGIMHEDSELTPKVLYFANNIYVSNKILYYVNDTPHESITRSYNIKKCYDNIIVADSLNSFCQEKVVEEEIKISINCIISLLINNSLRHTRYFSKIKRHEFDLYLHDRRELLIAYKKSKKIIYLIEYYLFQLTKPYYSMTYYLLSKIKD